MNLLGDLLSKDSTRICSASSTIATSRARQELVELSASIREIKSATKGVELGGALCRNSYHLEFAIKKLEFLREDSGCLCELYKEYMFFNPRKEQERGGVLIEEVVKIEDRWIDYYLCTCQECQSRFKVLERSGHYMWWSWEKQASPP